MPTRTITPGARLKAVFGGSVVKTDAEWEELAKALGIQPLTVEVPPTDGELWQQAWASSEDDEEMAETFLRLVRERDGEPLAVTGEQVCDWWHKRCVNADDGWEELAGIINAHRGVRELPKVTAEMFIHATTFSYSRDSVAYINAELAKARKDGAS